MTTGFGASALSPDLRVQRQRALCIQHGKRARGRTCAARRPWCLAKGLSGGSRYPAVAFHSESALRSLEAVHTCFSPVFTRCQQTTGPVVRKDEHHHPKVFLTFRRTEQPRPLRLLASHRSADRTGGRGSKHQLMPTCGQ